MAEKFESPARKRKLGEIKRIVELRMARRSELDVAELRVLVEKLETKILDTQQAAKVSALLEVEEDNAES